METIIFDTIDDDRLIQQARRFCSAIDKYITVLGINAKEVEALKGDVNMVVYVTSRSPSFSQSFIESNIRGLRTHFTDLCNTCVGSFNYRRDIGIELGLETGVVERTLYSEYLGA